MSNMALRSFEWTFIKKPLGSYELPDGQDTPVERPLSVPNVHLDALDLFFNQRGIGWSWSSFPFPRARALHHLRSLRPWLKHSLKITVLDTTHYVLFLRPSFITKTGGGSIFNATISFISRIPTILPPTFIRGLWLRTRLELTYHVVTLIGRILLRQPASHWLPFLRRPWRATSIRDFWSVRCHKLLRHVVIMFGARPCGALLGLPGVVMGGFAISGFIHIVGLWGIGHETDFLYDAGFFVLMGIDAILECAFQQATGLTPCESSSVCRGPWRGRSGGVRL